MKKYKLIKAYPGSPEVGYITSFNDNGEDWNTPNMLLYNEDCSKYPEFWEEVIEKDYEILSLKIRNDIVTKDNKNTWNGGHVSKCTLNYLLDTYKNSIYSIKRLSDGEIFTVDDNVVFNKIHKFKIEKFYFDSMNKHLLCSNMSGTGHVNITKISKVIEPLFTTEDGVDIFDKDTAVYEVFPGNFLLNKNILLKYTNSIFNSKLVPTKVFSTKEAAEQYIFENKPCLSYKDIIVLLNLGNYEDFELRSFIKRKLNS